MKKIKIFLKSVFQNLSEYTDLKTTCVVGILFRIRRSLHKKKIRRTFSQRSGVVTKLGRRTDLPGRVIRVQAVDLGTKRVCYGVSSAYDQRSHSAMPDEIIITPRRRRVVTPTPHTPVFERSGPDRAGGLPRKTRWATLLIFVLSR